MAKPSKQPQSLIDLFAPTESSEKNRPLSLLRRKSRVIQSPSESESGDEHTAKEMEDLVDEDDEGDSREESLKPGGTDHESKETINKAKKTKVPVPHARHIRDVLILVHSLRSSQHRRIRESGRKNEIGPRMRLS